MANYSKKPQREQSCREEIIQQLNQLLTTAHTAAGGNLNPEVVNKLLSILCEILTTSTVTKILEEEENEVLATILEELKEKNAVIRKANTVPVDFEAWVKEVQEKVGINFWNDSQQLKLEGLLESAPSLIVKRAIGKYVRHYGRGGGKYPAALFCKVLENELLQDFDEAA